MRHLKVRVLRFARYNSEFELIYRCSEVAIRASKEVVMALKEDCVGTEEIEKIGSNTWSVVYEFDIEIMWYVAS